MECLLFDEGEDGRVLDYFDSYTIVNSLMIFQVQVQVKAPGSRFMFRFRYRKEDCLNAR